MSREGGFLNTELATADFILEVVVSVPQISESSAFLCVIVNPLIYVEISF